MTYKTPGVYVEEISKLPPSVAEVSTAIPAFIGYTEKHSGQIEPVRINTLLEFQTVFGGAEPLGFTVQTDANGTAIESVAPANTPKFLLYYAVEMYFRNGGSTCYIVSVGDYSGNLDKDKLMAGLEAVETEDEPTLILLGDAVNLLEPDYYALCEAALAQCQETKDRFCILDVKENDLDASNFRAGVGTQNLDYGAAYFPYLKTSLTYAYNESEVQISGFQNNQMSFKSGDDELLVSYVGLLPAPKVKLVGTHIQETGFQQGDLSFSINENLDTLTINGITTATGKHTGQEVVSAFNDWNMTNPAEGFTVTAEGTGLAQVTTTGSTLNPLAVSSQSKTLAEIKQSQTGLYNSIKAELENFRVVLPPSGPVAGVYAQVDRDRGVWKAPANVSVSSVIGPTVKVTNSMQDRLNIDAVSGKSINAIRAFPGKGTLIWGARTLAGNDNEWKYVPVRRLFVMVEESVKKASAFAVFEPNDAGTWLKVRAMIESFLYGLWQRGAMAGASSDAAYYVNIGLGTTMTSLDVLEGRMNVEIGIAAVRPAEFIVLKFSHKLQES